MDMAHPRVFGHLQAWCIVAAGGIGCDSPVPDYGMGEHQQLTKGRDHGPPAVANAGTMGKRLLEGLQTLAAEFESVGSVRGLGLMCGIEFVADRTTKAPANLGEKIRKAALERGLFTRVIGDTVAFAPPLMINADEVDQMLQILGESIATVTK